uniref:Uncharacterized protein n=1 Tax=Utricularia reniformis TaxID=192314 RepID=A0A1Y0B0Q4_9LAMI|nr:hypothetical protein AEK19_MT0705 [Utricularia reniformis]ART30951.1 hypothetical protein AEK19_MT0705 [Utricularia reniformis]
MNQDLTMINKKKTEHSPQSKNYSTGMGLDSKVEPDM